VAETRILVRTTRVDARLLELAERLRAASRHPVSLLADARFADAAPGFDTIPVSRPALEALGLYCPRNFAWRCGDYGFYLARSRYPAAGRFWMIEYDVRFSVEGLEAFFAALEALPADFLVARLARADPDWYWSAAASARDAEPYRCLFPVTRLSARAVDLLLAKRRAHGRDALRRWFWPNDEVFVATTLMAAGLDCRDLNDGPAPVYDEESFGFFQPIEGGRFERGLAHRPGFRIFHPVLYGEDHAAKLRKLAGYTERSDLWKRLRRAALRRANARRRW
jgi:hypothetical protein